MPTLSDFTTVELQASVFTAGINFRTAKALPVLLQACPQRFTKIVHASDLPPNAPPEFPQVIIQSEDARYKAQAGPARLDLFWLRQAPEDILVLREHLTSCSEVIGRYLEAMQGWSRRLGCILNRVALDANPAATLARHFFKDDLVRKGGPIESPSEFEVSSAKQYTLKNSFPVNSWVKFKSVLVLGPALGAGKSQGRPAMLAQQDINTKDETTDSRFTADQISHFFDTMPEEFDEIMRLYFPGETQ